MFISVQAIFMDILIKCYIKIRTGRKRERERKAKRRYSQESLKDWLQLLIWRKKKQFFRGFTFTIKLIGRYRDFPHTPSPYRIHALVPSLSTFCTEWYICYNWCYNWLWHIMITQSPWFTLRFTFGVTVVFQQIPNDMFPHIWYHTE